MNRRLIPIFALLVAASASGQDAVQAGKFTVEHPTASSGSSPRWLESQPFYR